MAGKRSKQVPGEPGKKAAKPRTLKVYQAQFGFYDSVVAASSQTAALRAWGIHQNLFADGEAHVTTEADAMSQALANPDIPLRRPIGSTDPFSLDPAQPRLPDVPRSRKAVVATPPKPAPRPAPPDRTALDRAEAARAALDADMRREEAALLARKAELDREEAGARARWKAARAAAEKAVERERRAYVQAGGSDEMG